MVKYRINNQNLGRSNLYILRNKVYYVLPGNATKPKVHQGCFGRAYQSIATVLRACLYNYLSHLQRLPCTLYASGFSFYMHVICNGYLFLVTICFATLNLNLNADLRHIYSMLSGFLRRCA